MNTNTKPHLQPFKWERGITSPNPNGRPKMLKTMLKHECNLTPSQTNEAIMSILAYTRNEIQYLALDESQPMYARMIANALIKDYQRGSLNSLESLLNRTQGTPKQQIQVDTFNERPIFVGIDLDIR
jgi:hypothetical protein